MYYTSEKYTLECCVDSVESAMEAAEGGADRLELCSNLIIGGTTPTLSLFNAIRKKSALPIHVLIRPRFGDFHYTPEEFAIILEDVRQFRDAGAEGVVVGCLTPEGCLDLSKMEHLMKAAGPMSVTLHRAFDMCKDPMEALRQAIQLGIRIILTSGQAPTCLEGMTMLKNLLQAAEGRVIIQAGAGVNKNAVSVLLAETALRAYHMSGKKVLPSKMRYRNPAVSMGLPSMSEYEIWRTDKAEVQKVRTLLDEASAR